MLVQAMAVAIYAPATSRMEITANSGPLQSIVICSAHGAQTILVDADGNPVSPAPNGTRHDCALCLVLGAYALTGPTSTAGIAARSAAAAEVVVRDDAAPDGSPIHRLRIRGPPAHGAA